MESWLWQGGKLILELLGIWMLFGLLVDWAVFRKNYTFLKMDSRVLMVSRVNGIFFISAIGYSKLKYDDSEEVCFLSWWSRKRLYFKRYREDDKPLWKISVAYRDGDEIYIQGGENNILHIEEQFGNMVFGGLFDQKKLDDNPRYKNILKEAQELYKKARQQFRPLIENFEKTSPS